MSGAVGRERENNPTGRFGVGGIHDSYAKEVLRATFGERFTTTNDGVFSFGPGAGTGKADGIIDGNIAVEIGVGSPKQIRASVLDLIFHPLRGKLLVLVDTPGHSTRRSVQQAATILGRAGCSGVGSWVCLLKRITPRGRTRWPPTW